MPRKPRVDMVGHYHIVNRGVEQRVIYLDDEDHETFLEILCIGCQLYKVQLHAYVLMSNHYHLLIETKDENLSHFMKHLNASYAIYFNKKYKRSGHLWQGRFRSWFVTDEAYLYTLVGYIENNPLKAKMVKQLGEYPYSSYQSFVEETESIACLKNSFVFDAFKTKEERKEFLQCSVDEHLLDEIKKASNLVVTSIKDKKLDIKKLTKMFANIDHIEKRNKMVLKAYERGYSQYEIAKVLDFSQAYINKIIKKQRSLGVR